MRALALALTILALCSTSATTYVPDCTNATVRPDVFTPGCDIVVP